MLELKMPDNVYTVKIAGPAGQGIKSGGLLLSNILLKHGFNLRDYSEYPSLVRGGHNTYQVSFSTGEIFAPHFNVDLFFSLTSGHWQAHQPEFSSSTLVLGDDAVIQLPLKELNSQLGSPGHGNTICLGVAAFLLGLDPKICLELIPEAYGSDPANISAFNLGFEHAHKNLTKYVLKISLPGKIAEKTAIYDGNEAFGWGFIQGGGSFYAAYPMTPVSGALHFLAKKQSPTLTVVHPEDEIAVASMALGAAYAGVRSAVGTSGGGFALMTESVSFAGAAGLGVVFYLGSRPGPATGLPTWTNQGDLLFAVHSGHGEFNKIVLAPGDQQESFDLCATALNLAARFNLPVILLTDKFICESSASLPDLSAKKVTIVKSSLPVPGTPDKEFLANSYEHDDQGFSTEDAGQIKKNVITRQEQLKSILVSVPKPTFYFGSPTATTLIVTWGSVKSTVHEALRILNNPDLANLHFSTLWPIASQTENLFKPFKNIVVVENNATAQFTQLLKSQIDFHPTKTILKFDGRPFFPEELVKEFSSLK
jgi:2-oxoglutarate ferredoxin oxidoreductase subunit alpha